MDKLPHGKNIIIHQSLIHITQFKYLMVESFIMSYINKYLKLVYAQ